MIAAAIALASAACWGASDFLGGIAARRISPFLVVFMAHAMSLLVILAAILFFRLPSASGSLVAFGLAAGIFGGGGLVLFYQALSAGSMGITAAAAGVLTAAVPMIFGLHIEGLPKIHQLFGFALAVCAIWLIASAPGKVNRRALGLGSVSGICFGVYFVVLKLANGGGPLSGVVWSMALSRTTSTSLALLLCLWQAWKLRRPHQGIRWGKEIFALTAAIGALDTGGNMLYIVATHFGRMDVAAVLSSLYPAGTILLAAWILKERTTRIQTIGMALAVGAVALIAA